MEENDELNEAENQNSPEDQSNGTANDGQEQINSSEAVNGEEQSPDDALTRVTGMYKDWF